MEPIVHTKPFLSESRYKKAKWAVQIVLPGLATFYYTLSVIWGLPLASEIVGSLAALATFLGVILGISGARYSRAMGGAVTTAPYAGDLVIETTRTEDDGELIHRHLLELREDLPPETYEKMHAIAFRIRRS